MTVIGRQVFWVGVLLVTSGACRIEQRTPRPVGASSTPAGGAEAVLRVPADSEIPGGVLGATIRRGRALLVHTKDSLPAHVGNDLRCVSCHLREGTQPWAFPLVGVYARFPQYRARNDRVNLIEDRVNDCFERSLNGTALPADGPEMRAMVAYLAFLSKGIASPGVVPGLGIAVVNAERGDPERGKALFATTCVRCHGGNGEGTALAPPLWGARSFNIGAGLARYRTAAAFIRDNMPFDRAVVLTDQQALDLAVWVMSRPRPDFADKSGDWPRGDPPPDLPYSTRASPRKP